VIRKPQLAIRGKDYRPNPVRGKGCRPNPIVMISNQLAKLACCGIPDSNGMASTIMNPGSTSSVKWGEFKQCIQLGAKILGRCLFFLECGPHCEVAFLIFGWASVWPHKPSDTLGGVEGSTSSSSLQPTKYTPFSGNACKSLITQPFVFSC
jgi:hypothetical protein